MRKHVNRISGRTQINVQSFTISDYFSAPKVFAKMWKFFIADSESTQFADHGTLETVVWPSVEAVENDQKWA